MYNYNKLFLEFLQYKRFLGYKYRTDEIVLKEIVKYLKMCIRDRYNCFFAC